MLWKLYLIALPVFLAIDMLWLGIIAKDFYSKQIGSLMKSEVNWIAAGLFYIFFVFALVVFVIAPAVGEGSWKNALLYGAFFGFIAYATYDLTNFATLKNWPLLVTVIDLVWGAFIGASVSIITYFIAGKIGL